MAFYRCTGSRFHAEITVTANPGSTITATCGGKTYSGVASSGGTVTITVKKKGTYTVKSSYDSNISVSVNVLESGHTYTADARFLSTVIIQTNPSVNVSTTCGSYTYSGTANGNGVLALVVRAKGTYSVSSGSGASAYVSVTSHNGSHSVDCVYVGTPSAAVGTWSSLTACPYWSWGSYASGMLVYRNGTQIYNGGGSWLQLNASSTVLGVTDGGLGHGSYYTYTFRQYYNVNGRTFYSADVNIGYTAYSIGGSESFTYTRNYTVPTGVRSIYIQAVGAGGDGSGGSYLSWSDPSNRASGGGGGGGGRIARQSISVLPGQNVSVTVGSGNTTVTANGTTITASKGDNGGPSYCYASDTIGGNGGNGGSGGGGGSVDEGSRYWGKTAGGSNGGNGTGGSGGPWSGNPGSGGTGSGADCYINGTLFATGGAGGTACAYNRSHEDATAGAANTGNGGGGGYGEYGGTGAGAAGGTGFCLVSW